MSEQEAPQQQPKRPFWMRALGLRRSTGRLPFWPTRWGWILGILLIGAIAGGSFAEYSMQPEFCRSCHLMEPYYQAWHSSTHKDVSCVMCHFEPGADKVLWGKFQASSQAVKLVTQTYGSKPHAEVRDTSCMRSGCHEKRLLMGKVDWKVQTVRGGEITIRFDHTPHLNETRRGKQLRCVSCHSQIVQGQHLVVTLDSCYLCHMKGFEHGRNEQTLTGCTACHEAPKREIRLPTGVFTHAQYTDRGVACQNCHSDIVRGDGAVSRQTCWTCHNQDKQVQRFNDSAFLHQEHVTDHKVECQACHLQIQHGINASQVAREQAGVQGSHPMVAPDTCTSCHERMHGGPADIYTGKGARGVPEMPSPMSRAQVDCIACHRSKKETATNAQVVGQTYKASEEGCNLCHGPKYNGMIETWKQEVAVLLSSAEKKYDRSRLLVQASSVSEQQKADALKLLEDAQHNIRLVKLGHGVHNVNYATATLNAAIDYSEAAVKALNKAPETSR